ncbi:hypothetical protein C8R44DRAFT_850375 [Mycena epipterygia]|nr:hypothetical protein C8R44DRAFT_850375 [Mycena epipterygia]
MPASICTLFAQNLTGTRGGGSEGVAVNVGEGGTQIIVIKGSRFEVCGCTKPDSDTAMLLLLLLVHTLSTNSSLTQGNTLHFGAPVDSCDDINSCRRLFDIVWGCLTTIFACTWVSVHPNVPPPDQSRLALFWRRLKLMLIAVIAPELIVGFAARQFFAARKFSRKFDVLMTHGFFISMGGFVSQNGNPIVTIKQVQDSEYLSAIRKVKAASIMDKSKGDVLSKGVALLQGLWFITQCIARLSQHLPVTQLEVATLAFAIVNVLIWALWWAKPLDVEQPIMIGPAVQLQDAIPPLSLWDKFVGALTGGYSPYLPITSTLVPTFWSMDSKEAHRTDINIPLYIECLVGTIFGAMHCVAWNADFPSTIEMWMWRSCSLVVAAIPAVLGLFLALAASIQGTAIGDALNIILAIPVFLSIPLYPIARLFLITISFTSLRALPPRAFIDVNWSVYIPHL